MDELNHNSLTRKKRLRVRLIWVAVVLVILATGYNLFYHYYQKRVERAVQEALSISLNQHHIQIRFKKMRVAFLVRPHITLSDFSLIGDGLKLKSKKVNLSLTYPSLWQQMGVKTVELEHGHWQFSAEKNENNLWLLIKSLPRHLFPTEVHLKNNEIIFPYHNKNWHFTRGDFRLQITNITPAFFTLKAWVLPLKETSWPFHGSGYLSWEGNQLKGEQIELEFPYSFMGYSLENTLHFSFLWDKNSQMMHFKPLILEGHQKKAEMLNYHLRLEELIWQSKVPYLAIPKVSGDFSIKKDVGKINGYGTFLDFSCNDRSCDSDSVRFALNREKNHTSWISEGNGSAHYQTDKGSFLFHQVRLDSKLLGLGKERPYWSLNVLSELLFTPNRQIIAKAEGTLNQQALTLAVEKNLTGEDQYWQAQVYLKSFDLSNYYHQGSTSLTLKESYNQLLRQIPSLFSLFKDQNLQVYFQLGELYFLHAYFSNLQGLLVHEGNKFALESIRGQFFEGEFAGNFAITDEQPGYHYSFEQHLKHLNIGLMLYYFTGYPFLSGEGNAYLSLESTGSTVEEVLSSLSGFSSVDIDQGLLLNTNLGQLFNATNKINLLELIKEVKPRNIKSKKMPFNNLKFVGYWNNGVSDTLFLAVNGPEFSVRGSGSTDLKQYLLYYSLILTGDVIKNGKTIHVTLPILLTGTLLNPRYRLDHKRLEELFNASKDKGLFLKELLRRQWDLLR